MNKNGTFGTKKEITVFATMVQPNVMVFSSNWLCFKPAFVNDSCLMKK